MPHLQDVPRKPPVIAYHPHTFIVHCPRCAYAASARTEGRAINALGAHIATSHWPAWVERPAKGAA